LENAGGIWVDEAVVVDGNLISSRTPRDLAPFAKAMVDFLNHATRNT
jgi:protease I